VIEKRCRATARHDTPLAPIRLQHRRTGKLGLRVSLPKRISGVSIQATSGGIDAPIGGQNEARSAR
jgi:hypothetical protein